MKIARAKQSWLRRRPQKYGVEGASPLQTVSDTVTSLSVSPLVSMGACSLTQLVGGGVFGSLGMAATSLVAGAALGGLGGQLLQHGLYEAFGVRDPIGAESGGGFARKVLSGAAAGLVGSLAGTLSATPGGVALGVLGVTALTMASKRLLDRLDAL